MDEMANHGARIRRYVEKLRRGRGRDLHRPLHVDRRPDRHPLDRHPPPRARCRATTSRPSRGRGRSSSTRFKSKDYMDDYINPREVLKAEEEERTQAARSRPPAASPSSPEKDVLLFLIEHAPLEALAARRPVDRPRRGLLLRAAGPDQDHERGLGQLLALDDHDPEGAAARRKCIDYADHHSGTMATHARPAQSLQAGHRAVPRHRGPLEHRASSARNTTSATTWTSGEAGTRNSAWAGKKSSRSAASTTILPSSTPS